MLSLKPLFLSIIVSIFLACQPSLAQTPDAKVKSTGSISEHVGVDGKGIVKSIRLDGTFRTNVVRDAQALKKTLTFKPCEQISDYGLPYSPPTSPR